MLTAFDKLLLAVFTVVTLVIMSAAVCIPIIYLIPAQELAAPGYNAGYIEVALCLAGMALGYATSLALFGFLSRRFVSAETHQRWAQALDRNAPYVQYRAPALAMLIRWALIPSERRTR
jgi:hypothetical protein